MDDFKRRMEVLSARFAERAATDGSALRTAWMARDANTVRRISHGLAGNAGIFGYPELSDAARELEQALDRSDSDEELGRKLEAVLARIPAGPNG